MPTKHIVVCGLLGIIALGIGLFAPGFARASDPPARGYAGMDDCLYCHVEDAFADTLHPRKIRAPEAVLTTIIEGQEVSIFDSRTEGYETYVAPWAEYFNEDNVEFTIGGHWKQRFLTQIVPAEFSTGGDGLPIYSGEIVLPENYWVVMGIQWNVEHQRWQNYHGPTDENNWFMTPLRDPDDTTDRTWNKNCAGCHTTGYDPVSNSWIERDSDLINKGVTCEACHGPGRAHVRQDPGATIVNPATELTFEQRLDLCGSCHGRGKSNSGGEQGDYGYPYNEDEQLTFLPGDTLDLFYVQNPFPSSSFWGDGTSKRHHQQYLDYVQSGHVDAAVDCTVCHSSHGEGSGHGQTRLPGDDLCLSCHPWQGQDAIAYMRHSYHFSSEATCIDCHMPYTAKSINAYDIRSHTFRVIPPDNTTLYEMPNSCTTGCHNGVDPGAPLGLAEAQEALDTLLPFSSVFGDVPLDHWAVREIAAAARAGVVIGFPDSIYAPHLPVARAQMAVYIARALAGGEGNVPDGPVEATFPDVPTDHSAYKYVEYAVANNIVEGFPEGDYRPDEDIDRGQMAVFIARATADPPGDAGLVDYDPPATATFPDVPADFWAHRYVEFIAEQGVTQGFPDGLYYPEVVCTRDQMAVYVARAFELIP